MSSLIFLSIPGRITLTATFSPVFRPARWTCATDAVASATGSKAVKISASGRFSSDSMTSLDFFEIDRRDPVLQFFQFFDVLRRKDIRAGAHQLSQLDETGSEFFEDPAQTLR